MSITQLTRDMHIIAKLDDEPNDTGGLTAAQLKDKFDEAGVAIQTYLNATLIPEVEQAIAAGGGSSEGGTVGEIPTKVSQLENDAEYQTAAQVNAAILTAIADIPAASGVSF